ncbi:hypothetical protein [Thalassospira sp.]|uniref:hypothetical protein n=1 Tax=Thalassospira sp. TaxID=1912094 RepID=UPI002736D704|nr:hypothetical protein [Thalassospira sp.]MDP2699888.1 hypothetical protein [Thalassospira sp.]
MLEVMPSDFSQTLPDRMALFQAKARALSRLRRWNGASDVTVAQHLVDACDHAPLAVKGHILLHDIEEDETGDLITPVKHRMRALGIWQVFDAEIVQPVRRKYTAAAGLGWPCPVRIEATIKEIDLRLKVTEYRDTVDRSIVSFTPPPGIEAYCDYMLPWSPQKAEAQFMDRAVRFLPALRGAK